MSYQAFCEDHLAAVTQALDCPTRERIDGMNIAYYERRTPWLLRLLSCFEYTPREWRFSWGEVSWAWGFGLSLAMFEGGRFSAIIHPGFGRWFISLPFSAGRDPHEMMESWGFSWQPGPDLHLNWGRHTKIIWSPWRWDHVKTEILLADGTWRERRRPSLKGAAYDTASDPLPDVMVERSPYRYMLPDGIVQEVDATVTVERSEHRRRFIRQLPILRRRTRSIDIWFSDEVGERAGSWKGGCRGCGYEMRYGETPSDTLRRMQKERRFS